MNKAFVKEQEGDDENVNPIVSNLPAGLKNYITTQGYQRLKAELLNLIDHERPAVVQTVSWAASNGDRSENGDYIYGKKRLREIDRCIRFFTKRIEQAVVVDVAQQQHLEQVFFGATVEYADSLHAVHRIKIVGVDEVNLEKAHVSWISPIAKVLMKKKEGDVVTLLTPAGEAQLEILTIEYVQEE